MRKNEKSTNKASILWTRDICTVFYQFYDDLIILSHSFGCWIYHIYGVDWDTEFPNLRNQNYWKIYEANGTKMNHVESTQRTMHTLRLVPTDLITSHAYGGKSCLLCFTLQVYENDYSHRISFSCSRCLISRLQYGKVSTYASKCGMKLLIHFQTSTAAPLKFGNAYVISYSPLCYEFVKLILHFYFKGHLHMLYK